MVLKAASVKGLRPAGESQKWSFSGYAIGTGEGRKQAKTQKQRLMFSRTGTARDTGRKSTKSGQTQDAIYRVTDRG